MIALAVVIEDKRSVSVRDVPFYVNFSQWECMYFTVIGIGNKEKYLVRIKLLISAYIHSAF